MKVSRDLILRCLENIYIMQLATASGEQPWVCTVYFVSDEKLNIYWLSLPDRRHSQEIEKNPKVAVTMAIKQDLPVIGLGAEGTAETVNDKKIVAGVIKKYIAKYNSGEKFYQKFLAGENQHRMYKLTPAKYVLFDEVNFPKDKSVDYIV